MVIYADILLLTNLYIDFLLLACVKKFLRLRVSTLRLLPGAFAGALFSLCALLPQLPTPLSLLLGIFGAACVTFAAFAPNKWNMLLKAAAAYWMFSFIFAGFSLFIYHFFAPKNLAVRNGLVYLPISPLALFGFTLAAYLVLAGLQKLFAANDKGPDYQRFTVFGNGTHTQLLAKADTGNSLREPFSGLPVLVAEASALNEIAPKAVLDFLENGQAQEKLRLVPYTVLNGNGVLPAFLPEKIFVSKTEAPVNCYIAVSAQKLSAGQFNALYHPELLSEAAPRKQPTQPARAHAGKETTGAGKGSHHVSHH